MVAGHLSTLESLVAKIFDAVLRARFHYSLFEAHLARYRGVLIGPKPVRLHQLAETEIDANLTTFMRHAIVLTVRLQLNGPVGPDQSRPIFVGLVEQPRRPDVGHRRQAAFVSRAVPGTCHGTAGICYANAGLMFNTKQLGQINQESAT